MELTGKKRNICLSTEKNGVKAWTNVSLTCDEIKSKVGLVWVMEAENEPTFSFQHMRSMI